MLEGVQQRGTKMTKGLEHLMYKEKLRAWRREHARRPYQCVSIPDGTSKDDKAKLFSVVPESGQLAKGTTQNTVNKHLLWLLPPSKCCSRDCVMIMVLTLQKSAPNSHLHFSPSLFPGVRDRDGKVLVLLVQRSRTRGWINQSFGNSRQRGRTFENASSCWQQPNKGSLERHAEAVTGMQWASLGLRDLSYNSRIEKWS